VSVPSPPIDRRGRAELAAETEQLARELSGWRPDPDGRPDAGSTLIRVFAQFAELVVDRLNRAPERNQLAFLNLIGTAPTPPRPARVPLTFTLAGGSPVDAAVPAGTLAGAPPAPGEDAEAIFETERDLVVTRATLAAVITSDTEADTFSDRTAWAAGAAGEPFAAFGGVEPSPHHLYVGLEPSSGALDLELTLTAPQLWQWGNWPIAWEWWDGDGWRRAGAGLRWDQGVWKVSFGRLPQLPARVVDGVEAGWVRARLELALPPGESGNQPDALATGNRNPAPPGPELTVFGDAVQRFYIAADDSFGAGGARATLRFRLARRGVAPAGTQLTWSYLVGDSWVQLAGLADGTGGLTADGEVSFQVPLAWPVTTYRTRRGRWLRADVSAGGPYRTAPVVASVEVAHDWQLPTLNAIGATRRVLATRAYNDFAYTADVATPFVPTADTEPALYLGLDQPFDPRPVSVYLGVEPPRPEEVAADELATADPDTLAVVTWEYDGPGGWRPLGARDETQRLGGSGLVSFAAPAGHTRSSRFGRELYWLRGRWQRGAFPLPPRLRRVLLNTMWATQAVTVTGEILGSGNGNPGQVVSTAQAPVLDGRLVVRERAEPEEVWVEWQARPDLYESGPADRHYTLDPLTGEIRFGDGRAGMVPPAGQNNLRMTYRTGGGEQGNRPAGTIVELKTAVPYVDGVTNLEPAEGGAALEPIERLQARGPRALRHGGRAITTEDLEDLAMAASPALVRAAAVLPAFNPYALWLDKGAAPRADHAGTEAGRAGVVVVPQSTAARPTPSLGLIDEVRNYVRARCPATADIWVAGPEWIAVRVGALLVPVSLAEADEVGARVTAELERFLHPLRGGPDGSGWAFGRRPHRSDLFALVMGVAGVDTVTSLDVTLEPDSGDPSRRAALVRLLRRPLTGRPEQPELERELRRWLDRALVYSGTHEIRVAP
jgi:hypothetical protein